MDPAPPPRVGDPSARTRIEERGDAPSRRALTPSHRIAIGVAVVVVSTVAVLAFILTRSGDSSPPDGTYRLVARDSSLCLTVVAPSTSPTPGTPSSAPTGATVYLSSCPDAGGPLGAAATAPAAVSGRTPGVGTGLTGTGLTGTGVGTDADPAGSLGRWAVGTTDGAARRALHPAVGADLCLTVTGRATPSPVALETCRSSGAQSWSLRQVGRSDYFQVVADQGRRCLDAVTVDGAVVAVEKMCSSAPSQQWRFDPAD